MSNDALRAATAVAWPNRQSDGDPAGPRRGREPGANAPTAVNKWHVSRTLTRSARASASQTERSACWRRCSRSIRDCADAAEAAARGEGDGGRQGGGSSCELVVFPSNKALAQRAHGMAPKTLWRHLTALVEAG